MPEGSILLAGATWFPIGRTEGGRVIVLQKPVRTGELIDRLTAAIDEAAG